MNLSFSQPYPSQRAPVCAKNVVASSQPLATQAGINAMRKGGNAIDAAIATAITLTVVEPCMNGLGSDAFSIFWDGEQLHGLNASGHSPAAWQRTHFDQYETMPEIGWDTVTTPGAVSAWVAMSEKFGDLAFEDLFEDALRYASDGFAVGPISASVWRAVWPMYETFPDFVEHFGPPPRPGQTFVPRHMHKTLQQIATSRGESFYRGELAQKIADAATAAGGGLSLEDLALHEAQWVEPIQQDYADVTLHEIPPNGQGLAAQIALAILKHFDLPPLDSAESLHLQIEAMKIAIATAFEHFSDPQFLKVSANELLDEQHIAKAAASIGKYANPIPPVPLATSKDTVYLCAADKDGRMVSFIQSNYLSFGSGIVIPQTGIAMQNRGAGFTLKPGHVNEVGPRKRPFHTIIPGFVTKNAKPKMAFGVMGGHMQAQGHVQMMLRIFQHQQNPQAASDAPRWIVREDFSVGLEAGIDKKVAEELSQRGHAVSYDPMSSTFGGAQLIYNNDDSYIAGSDHRKEGHAAGY